MIYDINEIKNKVIPIVSNYGVLKISLFGSYARGEANDDSDIDFIIETDGHMGAIKYVSLLNELKNQFDCSIDLITTGFSNKDFLNNIKEDEVLLYERKS